MKALHTKGKHLYFIRSGKWVKIGRSDNVERRLKDVRVNNPFGAFIVESVEDAGEREHEVHENWKHRLHLGEWYELSDAEVAEIAKGISYAE